MTSSERTAHVRLLLRAGVAAWLRNAVPGTNVDDEVGHERVLVWPVPLSHWFVVSPDDDCWVEDLSARSARDGPSVVEEPLLHRFRDELSREKLLRLMNEGRGRAEREPVTRELRRRELPMWAASGYQCGLRRTERFCSRFYRSDFTGGGISLRLLRAKQIGVLS